MSQHSVAAVVVTFNRRELLIECLDSLLTQTYPVSRIILINNASSDDTDDVLKERGYLDNPLIHYKRMHFNLGGAGGFYEGVKTAHEMGFDWAWVMDDDAEPLPDALEKLRPYFDKENTVAACSIVVDNEGNLITNRPHRGWFDRYKGKMIAKPVMQEDIAGKTSIEIDHCSFVGLCFSLKVVDKIGLPKREMFIQYDDSEYCTRLKSVGRMHLDVSSVIKHKETAQCESDVRNFLGKRSCRVSLDKLWIQYFGYRNIVWMIVNRRIESSLWVAFRLHIRTLLAIIIYDDKKLTRIVFWSSAFVDGLVGRFDNSTPRRILDYFGD